ncbi:type II toxin-antitoxin system RelE/ParE family toxin [Polynucleobacter brandtiae]|uniref:Proteic killer suppression protein n=1 Tax=Polynucleobacter brandtiae TaxID=1938816 RepID=A0A2M8VR51_9BURK|nr:type II toxin-antitoxin system RelE/ParE family toxin [Polynucleobacter brandtiae]PJI79921.1 proteic killer suppression protein [Polynucleobacter brandtiae]
MIVSFRHKGLESFFIKGSYKAIPAQFGARIERILDRLDSAIMPEDMDLPGLKFHELKGKRRGVYSVTASGNWRITFQFDGDSAIEVDLEDYH